MFIDIVLPLIGVGVIAIAAVALVVRERHFAREHLTQREVARAQGHARHEVIERTGDSVGTPLTELWGYLPQAVPLYLQVSDRAVGRVLNSLGFGSQALDDEAFDARFLLVTNDVEAARAILGGELRDALMAVDGRLEFTLGSFETLFFSHCWPAEPDDRQARKLWSLKLPGHDLSDAAVEGPAALAERLAAAVGAHYEGQTFTRDEVRATRLLDGSPGQHAYRRLVFALILPLLGLMAYLVWLLLTSPPGR